VHVIGTAGHVDHGKSTLVKALTGIDPDRLAEEKEREMTIDLGFAWLTLGEEEVGIVDVPGHRDFIENMLAGVGGIDLALFVVAADEGIMPQTREHLAILDLLGIDGGIVVLTKMDLIDDPDWLELVMLDVSEALAGSVLEDAPIVPLSAYNGEGLDELKNVLQEKLSVTEARTDFGRPRLSVDRTFTLAGFGNIVTGTLVDGRFRIGDQVEIQPGNRKGRIRGLQTHQQKLDIAKPGSRVAINLSGIDRKEIRRGDVVAAPGAVEDTILFDAAYRHLPDVSAPLKHNMQVKLFVGAAEVIARTRVLGVKQIEPGQNGWLQLALQEPVALVRGDRFILRLPSPAATLGGGHVLDPHPGRRHRRFRSDVTDRLQTLTHGTPAELLAQTLARIEPTTQHNLFQQSGLDPETAKAAWRELEEDDQVIWLGKQIISYAGWQKLIDKLANILSHYHRDHPLRLGMPREELRSRLELSPVVFNPLLAEGAAQNMLIEEGSLVRSPDHAIVFSPSEQKAINQLLQKFVSAGANSPSVKESKTLVRESVYHALVDLGELRQLNADVVYAANEYKSLTKKIVVFLQANQRINAAQARDLLGTSRKYAIALLEHLDDIKVTRRVGDFRELS
jgi:selenocysteine-specific elongation factor